MLLSLRYRRVASPQSAPWWSSAHACTAGAKIVARTYAGADHNMALLESIVDAQAFADDVLEVVHRGGDQQAVVLAGVVEFAAAPFAGVLRGRDGVLQLGELRVPELTPDDFEDVASTATLTTKETAPGHKYYYWQWNRNGKLHSQYAAPVDDCRIEYTPPERYQSTLSDW